MPLVSTEPTFCGRSVTKPAEDNHSEPPGARWISAHDGATVVAVVLLIQFEMIASAPKPWIAPLILMSYQSAVSARRGMNRGWITAPTVFVVAISGFRFGLPPSRPLYCSAGLLGVLDPTIRPCAIQPNSF